MKKNRIKLIIVGITVFLILFLILNNYLFYKDYQELSHASDIDSISLRMNSLFTDLNNFPRSSVQDILYLSKMSCTKSILSEDKEIQQGETDVAKFIDLNKAYYQIIAINDKGKEVLMIKNVNDIQKEYILRYKNYENESFLKKIRNAKEGEVVISDIKLEEGIPVLIYSTPIYENDLLKGYLILKANADYFLDDIRYAQRSGEKVFLINSNGEYLANENREKEFKEDITIYTDYPQLKEETVNTGLSLIETEKNIFSLKYLTILGGYFTEYSGDEKEDLWTLVFVSEKDSLKESGMKDFIFQEIPLLIIMFLLIGLFYYQWRKNEK